MQAHVITAQNKPLIQKEVPDPLLKAGMVHIRMRAAALNHRDLWINKGKYAGLVYPVIPGSDMAGVVEEVGKDVPEEWVGRDAIINPSLFWGTDESVQAKTFSILGMPAPGGLCEIVAIHREHIFPMPEHLTYVQAAALPLAGLTAWRALTSRADTQGADKVLVTGTGGGVALFALQFALAMGCEVWVTSGSKEKLDKVKLVQEFH